MSKIKDDVREEMALFDVPGQAQHLVGARGNYPSPQSAARAWAKRNLGPVVAARHAGRADDGSQVFLVTYETEGEDR